jgi:hypothetical protein
VRQLNSEITRHNLESGIIPLDRDRGAPHDAAPPTPPGIGVPTSAVREVALTCAKQGWKTERSEVCVGKPHREGFAPR